ncbi:MAG: methyltransferase [Bacillota bacterium]
MWIWGHRVDAAERVSPGRVIMVDSSFRAVELARANAVTNGLSEVTALLSDGWEAVPELLQGQVSVVLANPPYHTDYRVPRCLLAGARRFLRTGGNCYFVVKRAGWYRQRFQSVFRNASVREVGGYSVVRGLKSDGVSGEKVPTGKLARRQAAAAERKRRRR